MPPASTNKPDGAVPGKHVGGAGALPGGDTRSASRCRPTSARARRTQFAASVAFGAAYIVRARTLAGVRSPAAAALVTRRGAFAAWAGEAVVLAAAARFR
jgi:hypothetical protein